jgi:hypothetical protein
MVQLVKSPNAQLPLVDLKSGAPSLSGGGMSLLQNYADALNGTSGIAAPGVNQVKFGTGTHISSGSGSPEGVVPGSPGDFYTNTTGGEGQTLWVKETGVGTATGWQNK